MLENLDEATDNRQARGVDRIGLDGMGYNLLHNATSHRARPPRALIFIQYLIRSKPGPKEAVLF